MALGQLIIHIMAKGQSTCLFIPYFQFSPLKGYCGISILGNEICVNSPIISKYQRYPSNWQANCNETKWYVNNTASNEKNDKLMVMIFRLITRNFFPLLFCNFFYVMCKPLNHFVAIYHFLCCVQTVLSS